MKITTNFIELAFEYYRVYNIINETEDYDNEFLWKQITDLEDTIFKPFHVFYIQKRFADLMTQFVYEKVCTLDIIYQLFDDIYKESILFFTERQRTKREILEEGILRNISAMEILNQMDIYPDAYSIFVVNYIFRVKKHSIDEVLLAIEKNCNASHNINQAIGKLKNLTEIESSILIMKEAGLSFLEECKAYFYEYNNDLKFYVLSHPIDKFKGYRIFNSFEITKLIYFKNMEDEPSIKFYFSVCKNENTQQNYWVIVDYLKLIDYLKNAINLQFFDLIVPKLNSFFIENGDDDFYEIDIVLEYKKGVVIKDLLVLKK